MTTPKSSRGLDGELCFTDRMVHLSRILQILPATLLPAPAAGRGHAQAPPPGRYLLPQGTHQAPISVHARESEKLGAMLGIGAQGATLDQ